VAARRSVAPTIRGLRPLDSYDPPALSTLEPRNLRENLGSTDRLRPLALEPPVPFDWSLWHEYQATEPFDLICLSRSPSYTPAAADAVYDEIRSRFIDENAIARSR